MRDSSFALLRTAPAPQNDTALRVFPHSGKPGECRPEWRRYVQIRTAPVLPCFMANGIICGMILKMDKSGRIVFPKALRDSLGLKANSELEAVSEAGGVLLRRVEKQPSMVRVDGLWVHRGTSTADANWGRVLDDVREERIQSVLKTDSALHRRSLGT